MFDSTVCAVGARASAASSSVRRPHRAPCASASPLEGGFEGGDGAGAHTGDTGAGTTGAATRHMERGGGMGSGRTPEKKKEQEAEKEKEKDEIEDAWWRGWNAASSIIDVKLADQHDEGYTRGWDDAMRAKAVEEELQKRALHEFAKSGHGHTTDLLAVLGDEQGVRALPAGPTPRATSHA